jgi:hypothetical protein
LNRASHSCYEKSRKFRNLQPQITKRGKIWPCLK